MQPSPLWQSNFTRLKSFSLPIYYATCNSRTLIYTPGIVCVMNKEYGPHILEQLNNLTQKPNLKHDLSSIDSYTLRDIAAKIIQAAQNAVNQLEEISVNDFAPECLTLYMNNKCNMRCRYCYSGPGEFNSETLSEPAVREAARLVAGKCAERKIPFTMVFHGGGEPTLNCSMADSFLGIAREESGLFGIQLQTYIATNGAVSEETAKWLANSFNLVGVSFDGPPEIQNRNRPGCNGQQMSTYVERTMAILKHQGCPFHVRVTITNDTVVRQKEIVTYIADHHAPDEIRIEPVYVNPSDESVMEAANADSFVSSFLEAKAEGARYGVHVSTSISRLNSVYGPYCNVLRRVLNLVPGDIATGCFLTSYSKDIITRNVNTGSFDTNQGTFRMDMENIRSLIIRCSKRPTECEDCLCSFQCTFGCPDRCVLDSSGNNPLYENSPGNFRCAVNRRLMEKMICEAVDDAWNITQEGQSQDIWDEKRKITVSVYRYNYKDEVLP